MSYKQRAQKQMFHWNKAYLDALEVPVWVPLNDLSEEIQSEGNQIQDSATVQPQLDSAAEVTMSLEQNNKNSFQLIDGDRSAAFAFLLPHGADITTAKETLKRLQFAWQAWLEQPLSAALLQPSTSSDSASVVELDSLSGQVIDCRAEPDNLEQTSISAPEFDFKRANKKGWWQLLQRLQ